MTVGSIAQTALWTAAIRARESLRPEKLFDDPLARVLAGEIGAAILEAEPPQYRDNHYVVVRTRFFDDWLERMADDGSGRQVVLLGAGMDTRAYRLAWTEGVTLWELDLLSVLEMKREILASTPAVTICGRRTLAVDLMDERWPWLVRASGFRTAEPSIWLAEGLFVYLEETAVTQILASVAQLAAPGSYLAADFVSQDFLDSPRMAQYLRALERRGSPWRFGTNEPEALLECHGWRALSVTQPGEKGASYGRWPWPVVSRHVRGYPRSFFVTAMRD